MLAVGHIQVPSTGLIVCFTKKARITIKATLLATISLILSGISYGFQSCVTVNDACCDDEYTAANPVSVTEYFEDFYVCFDATSENNQVTVRCWVDGSTLAWERTYCDCGDYRVYYPINSGHYFVIKAKCINCSESPSCDQGTSVVKVRTPENYSGCSFECQDPR